MANRITYGKLPQVPRAGVCLGCPKCQRTFSCQRSDYFRAPQELSPRCEDCGVLLKLVRKVTRYVAISPEQAEQPPRTRAKPGDLVLHRLDNQRYVLHAVHPAPASDGGWSAELKGYMGHPEGGGFRIRGTFLEVVHAQ